MRRSTGIDHKIERHRDQRLIAGRGLVIDRPSPVAGAAERGFEVRRGLKRSKARRV
jgi:hypothetical protein